MIKGDLVYEQYISRLSFTADTLPHNHCNYCYQFIKENHLITRCLSCLKTYCNRHCQYQDKKYGLHSILCQSLLNKNFVRYKSLGSLTLIALQSLTRLISDSLSISALASSNSYQTAFRDNLGKHFTQYKGDKAVYHESTEVTESWLLLLALFQYDKKYLSLTTYDVGLTHDKLTPPYVDISAIICDENIFTIQDWYTMLYISERYSVTTAVDSHYHRLALQLPCMSATETDSTLTTLSSALHYESVDRLMYDVLLPYSARDISSVVQSGLPVDVFATRDHFHQYQLHTSGNDESDITCSNVAKPLVGYTNDDATAAFIYKERAIMRLAQLALHGDHLSHLANTLNPFDKLLISGSIITPTLLPFSHSCCPNLFVEICMVQPYTGSGSLTRHTDTIQTTTTDITDGKEVEESSMRLRLVALRDISEGEERTINYNTVYTNYNKSSLLSSAYTAYKSERICICDKCVYDRNPIRYLKEHVGRYLFTTTSSGPGHAGAVAPGSDGGTVFSRDMTRLRDLADVYMQESNFSSAWPIYAYILLCHSRLGGVKVDSKYGVKRLGDVYHALGAALLDTYGMWRRGHVIWRMGYIASPAHAYLSEACEKLDAYRTYQCTAASVDDATTTSSTCTENNNCYSISILSKRKTGHPGLGNIFLSKRPLVSSEQCHNIIHTAELHASSSGSGWTTSRHYAVPTTDLPVHKLPLVLTWFNGFMTDVMGPLLYRQFEAHLRLSPAPHRSNANDNKTPSPTFHYSVHDAFVVKYQCLPSEDASVNPPLSRHQKYLPIHVDQSTHSLTIALNGAGEYVGGGTYFSDLDDAIRPGKTT